MKIPALRLKSAVAGLITTATALFTLSSRLSFSQTTYSGSGSQPSGTSRDPVNVNIVGGTSSVNQGLPGTQAWPVDIHDSSGSVILVVSTNGINAVPVHQADKNFIVSGLSSTGTVPALNPIGTAGIDDNKIKRYVLTNSSGALQITTNPTISTGNSTTIPLGTNAAFTGTFEDVSKFSAFTFIVFADQSSAQNGMVFQWSSDGVNVDSQDSSSYSLSPTNAGRAFNLSVRGKFFRVVYANGPVAQSVFRVQTIYHPTGSGIISKPLGGSVTVDNFASLSQSAVMGRVDNSTNTYSDLTVSSIVGHMGLVVADIPVEGHITLDQRMFFVAVETVVVSAVETPFLFFVNLSTNTRSMWLNDVTAGSSDGSSGSMWRVYANPVVTSSGTPQSSFCSNIGANNVSHSQSQIWLSPTVSSNGTEFVGFRSGHKVNSSRYNFRFGLFLSPGTSILVTTSPDGGGTPVILTLNWAEY